MFDALFDLVLKAPEIALAAVVWLVVETLRSVPLIHDRTTGPVLALLIGLLAGALFFLAGWIPFTWQGVTRAIVAILAPQGFQSGVFKSLIVRANGPPEYVSTPRTP